MKEQTRLVSIKTIIKVGETVSINVDTVWGGVMVDFLIIERLSNEIVIGCAKGRLAEIYVGEKSMTVTKSILLIDVFHPDFS